MDYQGVLSQRPRCCLSSSVYLYFEHVQATTAGLTVNTDLNNTRDYPLPQAARPCAESSELARFALH